MCVTSSIFLLNFFLCFFSTFVANKRVFNKPRTQVHTLQLVVQPAGCSCIVYTVYFRILANIV